VNVWNNSATDFGTFQRSFKPVSLVKCSRTPVQSHAQWNYLCKLWPSWAILIASHRIASHLIADYRCKSNITGQSEIGRVRFVESANAWVGNRRVRIGSSKSLIATLTFANIDRAHWLTYPGMNAKFRNARIALRYVRERIIALRTFWTESWKSEAEELQEIYQGRLWRWRGLRSKEMVKGYEWKGLERIGKDSIFEDGFHYTYYRQKTDAWVIESPKLSKFDCPTHGHGLREKNHRIEHLWGKSVSDGYPSDHEIAQGLRSPIPYQLRHGGLTKNVLQSIECCFLRKVEQWFESAADGTDVLSKKFAIILQWRAHPNITEQFSRTTESVKLKLCVRVDRDATKNLRGSTADSLSAAN
jgi:hypothetical protein